MALFILFRILLAPMTIGVLKTYVGPSGEKDDPLVVKIFCFDLSLALQRLSCRHEHHDRFTRALKHGHLQQAIKNALTFIQ